MANGYPVELKRRLEEKCREEQSQAKLMIAMGIPFAAGSLIGLTLIVWMILWLLHVHYLLAFFISFVVVAGAMAFDTWKHPSAHWSVARYYLAGAIDTPSDPNASTAKAAGGAFAGMPLMASVSDPANLAAQGEKVLQGCTNVILGGPRNIRAGIEQLQAVRARSDERVESAAVRFLAWLKATQPVTEEEVAETLGKDPSLAKGLALATELGFVTRRKEGPQRLFEMKE